VVRSAFGGATSYPSTADLAKAKNAIDTATRLAPDSFEASYALGDLYYYGYKDYGRALAEYEKLARLRPNDPIYLNRVAGVLRRQGHWAESLAGYRKLREVDPGNLRNRHDIVTMLAAGRRYDEAIVEMRQLVERAPDDVWLRLELGQLAYLASGSTKEMDQSLAQAGPDALVPGNAQQTRIRFALARGDINEAKRLERLQPLDEPDLVIQMAYALAAQGDHEGARARLGDLPAQLRALTENRPEDSVSWARLGLTEVLLGRKADAVREARQAVELLPESRDAILGAANRAALAQVLAWTGNLDAAIVEYAHLVRTPFGLNSLSLVPFSVGPTMRLEPRFAPLHGDPRFEALLDDPKNKEPLF
jgi:tetratricopeptide (TPR) repeat protein